MGGETDQAPRSFQSRLLCGVVWCGWVFVFGMVHMNLVIPRNAQLILLLCMVCWRSGVVALREAREGVGKHSVAPQDGGFLGRGPEDYGCPLLVLAVLLLGVVCSS